MTVHDSPLRAHIFDLKPDDHQELQTILLTLLGKIHELEEWRRGLLSLQPSTDEPHTTVGPGTTVRTEAEHLDVAADGLTTRTMLQSSPSDPGDMPSGPASQYLTCVHDWSGPNLAKGALSRLAECQRKCGAYWYNGRILVRVADETSLTSPSEASKSSAASSPKEPAMSQSSASLTDESGWWPITSASNRGHTHRSHDHEGGGRWHMHYGD